MQPSACCSNVWKCPKSPLASTDFGTQRGNMAITRIRVMLYFELLSVQFSIYVCARFYQEYDTAQTILVTDLVVEI